MNIKEYNKILQAFLPESYIEVKNTPYLYISLEGVKHAFGIRDKDGNRQAVLEDLKEMKAHKELKCYYNVWISRGGLDEGVYE